MEQSKQSAINRFSSGMKEAVSKITHTDNGFLRVSDPRQRALLRLLAFAFRCRVSAAPLVDRLSYEYTGADSLKLRQVAYLLAASEPVVSALEQTRGAVDETTLLALRLAEETGTLSETYDLLLSGDLDARFQTDDPLHSDSSQLIQRATGILVACSVLSFLMLFIVPTFQKMFYELGLELPGMLLLLIWLFSHFGSFLVLCSLGLGIGFVIFALWNRNWQWQPWKPVYPKLPASVRLRALLALVVGSGRPVEAGLVTLSRFQSSFAIRNRLVAATELIRQGENPWLALARQKLLRDGEAEALRQAPDRATQRWLLQQAAVAGTHWHESVRGIVLQAVSLCVMLLLAIVVGMTAISFFLALSELISGLA